MTATKVHVFLADTRHHDCESLATRLDLKSLERLAQITHPRRRAQFILGRILLRQALRQEFGAIADAWWLDATHGKPRLAGVGVPEISLSHSRQLVACAIAPVEVGLDVEYCRERDFSTLAERFCHPAELRLFCSLPKADRAVNFYRLWTRHEAAFKLSGGDLPASESGSTWGSNAQAHVYFQPGEGFIGAIVARTRHPIQLILNAPRLTLCVTVGLRD